MKDNQYSSSIARIFQEKDLQIEENIITSSSFGSHQLYKILLDFEDSLDEVYFPDAYIYSDKIRYRDLFREKIYAAYSVRTYNIALRKLMPILGDKSQSRILLVPHLMSLLKTKYFTPNLRVKDSCLLILPKSTATIRRFVDQKSLKEFVRILKSYYQQVNACIYWSSESCLNDFPFSHLFENTYSCGPRNNLLFYPRLSYLFSCHTSIASFTAGSHTLYSALYENEVVFSNKVITESRSDKYQDSRYPSRKELAFFDSYICQTKYNTPSKVNLIEYLDAPYPSFKSLPDPNSNAMHELINLSLKAYDKTMRICCNKFNCFL